MARKKLIATYEGEWGSFEDVSREYKDVLESEIIYAAYEIEGYEGSAIVVFERDGQLFENNDGHCSCNGLDCWDPEATSIEALKMRSYPSWDGLGDALDRWQASKPKQKKAA